jgi:HEAT repeat protein
MRSTPAALTDLLHLFADPDTPLSVRIGISAAVEHLAGDTQLRDAIPQILPLTRSESPQIRADACYFLGLTGDPSVLSSVQRLLEDESAEVREVAAETSALIIGPD